MFRFLSELSASAWSALVRMVVLTSLKFKFPPPPQIFVQFCRVVVHVVGVVLVLFGFGALVGTLVGGRASLRATWFRILRSCLRFCGGFIRSIVFLVFNVAYNSIGSATLSFCILALCLCSFLRALHLAHVLGSVVVELLYVRRVSHLAGPFWRLFRAICASWVIAYKMTFMAAITTVAMILALFLYAVAASKVVALRILVPYLAFKYAHVVDGLFTWWIQRYMSYANELMRTILRGEVAVAYGDLLWRLEDDYVAFGRDEYVNAWVARFMRNVTPEQLHTLSAMSSSEYMRALAHIHPRYWLVCWVLRHTQYADGRIPHISFGEARASRPLDLDDNALFFVSEVVPFDEVDDHPDLVPARIYWDGDFVLALVRCMDNRDGVVSLGEWDATFGRQLSILNYRLCYLGRSLAVVVPEVGPRIGVAQFHRMRVVADPQPLEFEERDSDDAITPSPGSVRAVVRLRRHSATVPKVPRDSVTIQDEESDYISWCECNGYRLSRGSLPFRIAEDILCCLSALFGCGENADSEDGVWQMRSVANDMEAESLFQLLDSMADVVASSQLGDVDLVRLVSFLTALTQQRTPIGVGSLVLATYPNSLRTVSAMVKQHSVKLKDFAIAMFADFPVDNDDPFANLVAVGDSKQLFSAMRSEFLVRLVVGEVFSGVFLDHIPGLANWVRRHAAPGTSVMSFAASLLSSCVRLYHHIVYYVDGDLDKYLASLDAVSAIVYRHGVTADIVESHGFGLPVMQRIEVELPLVDRALPKLAKGSHDFQTVVKLRGDYLTWRQQCNAKASAGDLPFCLLMVGPSRCGKSDFVDAQVPFIIASRRRLPIGEIVIARPRSSDAYDTEMKPNTHCVFYHDPTKDAILTERRNIMDQMFTVMSGQPYAMTKAAVEEKGLYACPPDMVVVTSNESSMRLDSGKVFVNHDALAARIQYGAWAHWPADMHTDPERKLVRWHIGRFDPKMYARADCIPYDKTAPGCGGPFTAEEFGKCVAKLFMAHHDNVEKYREQRSAGMRQCPDCFSSQLLCECTMHAISDPVQLQVAMPFAIQLWFYGTVLVPLLSCLFRLLTWVFVVVRAERFVDRVAVWVSRSTGSAVRDVSQRVPLIWERVRAIPSTLRTHDEIMARLQSIRDLRAHLPKLAAFAVVATLIWAWRKKTDVGLEKSLGIDQVGEDCGKGELLGDLVLEPFPIEEQCVYVHTEQNALSGYLVDERTLMCPAHMFGGDFENRKPIVTRVKTAKKDHKFVAYPEAASMSPDDDQMLLFTNTRLLESRSVAEFRKLDLASVGQLYVTGRDRHGKLKRITLNSRRLLIIPNLVRYTDSVFVGSMWEIPVGRGLGLIGLDLPHGSCGSIIHDGTHIYGHIVAAGSGNTGALLYEPWGKLPFDVTRCDTPMHPSNFQDPLQFMASRGLGEKAMHANSMFQHERVRTHWDYRGTIDDADTMRPRETRIRGPDAYAFECLSGIPIASLAESTGHSGHVDGVDHRMSPMEHMFENHAKAQSLPAPLLDDDPLLELKAFVRLCVESIDERARPLSTSVAINGDGTIKGMALDKSSGFPEGPKRDLMISEESGRLVASAGLLAKVEERYDALVERGELFPPIFRPFPKQGEILDASKVAAGKARIIMNALNLVQSIVVRRLMLPILLCLIKMRDVFGMLIGMSATNPNHVAAIAAKVKFHVPGQRRIAGDHAKLDLHQRFRMALLVMWMYIRVARALGYTAKEVNAVKRVCYTWLFPTFVYRGDVWTSRGDIWGSGTLGTDVFQSASTWLLHMECNVEWFKQDGTPPSDVVFKMFEAHMDDGVLVYGDDNTRNERVGGPTGAFLSRVTLLCGYEMTDALDKTQPPEPREGVSILKRTLKEVEYFGVKFMTMPLEIRSITKSLYLPKKSKRGDVDVDIYAACLVNANRELFLHGNAEFDKWHPTILTAWKALKVGTPPPEAAAQLLQNYQSGTYSTWDSGGQLMLV